MILLGPAGSPEKTTIDGIGKVRELGLQSMEVEFTHGVRMKDQLALDIGKRALEEKIHLSIHAPFFINLASKEKEKIEASKIRILDSAQKAHHMSVFNNVNVVFHPGFYMDRPKKEVYDIISEQMGMLLDTIKRNEWKKVRLALETTGKPTQFGDIDELLLMRKELGCHICVDFAHIYARNNGVIDYGEIFDKLRSIKDLHCHFSGIEYTAKGERKHLDLTEEFFSPLANQLMKRHKGRTINVISESPITWKDSLLMKRVLEKKGYEF